jgi:hypothetical protein
MQARSSLVRLPPIGTGLLVDVGSAVEGLIEAGRTIQHFTAAAATKAQYDRGGADLTGLKVLLRRRDAAILKWSYDLF